MPPVFSQAELQKKRAILFDLLCERKTAARYCYMPCWRKAGFFSEINGLLMIMLYCLHNGIQLYLDPFLYSRFFPSCARLHFADKGWENYFYPFCRKAPLGIRTVNFGIRAVFKSPILPSYNQHAMWNKVRDGIFIKQKFSIPELEIKGDFFSAMTTLSNIVLEYNEETKKRVRSILGGLYGDKTPYTAVHMRRGDKITLPGEPSPVTNAEEYINAARTLMAGKNRVFIAADDYAAYEEFRRLCPADWKLDTLCKPQNKGFIMTDYYQLSDHEREAHVLDLLADFHMLVNADSFVGCLVSNVDRAVTALRGGQNCRTLDFSVEDYRADCLYGW